LALLEAQLAHQAGEPAWLQTAIEHYQAGLSQEPILGLNSANLAGLLWQQGQQAEAIHWLEQTIIVEPDPLYLVNLGYFYEQAGDKTQASQAYGRALALTPDLAASGFWQATPERAGLWPQVVKAALASPAVVEEINQQLFSARLALAREDWEAIEMFAQPERQPLDEEIKPALVEFYLAQNQPEQAAAGLAHEPESAEANLLWGRIALLSGDEAVAERRFKTAVFLGSREANYYLGQLFEQQGKLGAAALAYQRAGLFRSISENIEVTIYGRLGGNDLAPQLLRIGLGRRQAQPLLALAQLRQDQQQFEEARRIYQLLLNEDPFLEPAQKGLAALEGRQISR
jgi:tetratricopeptide (TPR) repeat protein